MERDKKFQEKYKEMKARWLPEHKKEIAKHNAKVDELIEAVEAIKSKLTIQIINVIKENEKVRWGNEEDKKFNLQSNTVLKAIVINTDWINTKIDEMMCKVWDYNHEAIEAHNISIESEE